MAKDKEPIKPTVNLQERSDGSAPLEYFPIHKTLTIDLIVLVLYLISAAYVFSILISLRPNAGSWYLFLYLYLFPGIFNRLFRLLNRAFIKKYERRYRWSFSLTAVVAGLLLIRFVSSMANDIAMDRFELAFRPLVDSLHANEIAICNSPEDEIAIPDSIRPEVQGPGTTWIHFSESRFIISTRGGSIDIDGSTIYYDSNKKEWNLFHNDNQAMLDSYNLLIKKAKRCKFS